MRTTLAPRDWSDFVSAFQHDVYGDGEQSVLRPTGVLQGRLLKTGGQFDF
jgi:hypothetical protein